MTSFYTTASSVTEKNFFSSELSSILGCGIRINQLDFLNVVSFNENIMTIFKQIYAILLDKKKDIRTFYYIELDKILAWAEPVVYVKKSHYILHIFNQQFIQTFFNTPFDLEVRQILQAKKCLYKIRDNALIQPQPENTEVVTTIHLNELMTQNLLKLYTLADHAVEHLYLSTTNHSKFGKHNIFLSGIITSQPSPEIHNYLFSENKKTPFHKMFQLESSADENSDSDNDL